MALGRCIRRWWICAVATAAAAVVAPPAARSQAPAFLVKDLASQPAASSSGPGGFVTIGSTTYFEAWTPTLGQELWKTDGTAVGTTLVKDIFPGSWSGAASNPFFTFPQGAPPMLAFDGLLYFVGNDGLSGVELYRSDGTAAGTVIVVDVSPFGDARPDLLTEVDGTLFFVADDGVHGRELWKTDGTAAGTTLVVDLVPGSTGAFAGQNSELAAAGGVLVFAELADTSAVTVQVRNDRACFAATLPRVRKNDGTQFSATTP